eukprot:gene1455-2042_t
MGTPAYTTAAAAAKLTATENAQRVIDMALQRFGGRGVQVGQKIESLYRDIRSLRIYEGATEPDHFVHDRLPPPEAWPTLRYDLPELQIANQANLVQALFDQAERAGHIDRPLLRGPHRTYTYRDARAEAARIAEVLTQDHGLVPGNRVLLRGGNTVEMALAWLGTVYAGLVAVATMPLLRAVELG